MERAPIKRFLLWKDDDQPSLSPNYCGRPTLYLSVVTVNTNLVIILL